MDLRCIKIISVVTCLLYLSNVIAQPRVDGGTSAKVVKSSPVVSNFVGWVYDRTNEKWSGYYNCICGFYKNNNKVPQRLPPDDMALFNNMISLQIKKVNFEGEDYYLLLVPFYAGKYRYPAIEEDWYSKKITDAYVFTKDEYNKLMDLDENLTEVLSINETRFGDGIEFHCYYKTLSAAMNHLFENKKNLLGGNKSKFYLKLEDSKTIRFLNLQRYNEMFPDKKEPDFNSGYYEISASAFKQILI